MILIISYSDYFFHSILPVQIKLALRFFFQVHSLGSLVVFVITVAIAITILVLVQNHIG